MSNNKAHSEISNNELGSIGDPELQLKLLNRFRKIYLSKKRMLEVRKDGEITKEIVDSFEELLDVNGILKKKYEFEENKFPENKGNEEESDRQDLENPEFNDEIRKTWFDLTDRESFRAEADQLLKILPFIKAEELKTKIEKFEQKFTNVRRKSTKYLYYTKHTNGVIESRCFEINRYSSLRKLINANIPRIGNVDTKKAIDLLKDFINDHFVSRVSDYIFKDPLKDKNQTPDYDYRRETQFVNDNSEEFKRKILNAFFSEVIGVEPSEEVPFVKRRGGGIDYAAFRTLVWLRNKNFDLEDFIHFINNLNSENLPERMMIDLGLGGIVKTFINNVRDPKKVDNLIMTHRIVKGLWQNGSKFLNSYTLHNEDHAIKLINQSMEIIRRIDYLQLKRLDFYILFLACYLHDISMVIHPELHIFCHANERNIVNMECYIAEMSKLIERKGVLASNHTGWLNFWKETGGFMLKIFNEVFRYFESDVRDTHAETSADFVINKRNDLFDYLDATIVSAVARAGRDHCKPEYHIYDLASEASKDAISIKYISIVLRLADLMDVSNDRVNYHLLHENVKHLSPESKFHWISHLITDEIKLIPIYSLERKEISADKLLGKHRSIYPPNAYYIKENLRFYIVLNVKSLEPIDIESNNFMCKGWCRKQYNDSDCPSRYIGYEGISITFPDFEDKNSLTNDTVAQSLCSKNSCPMICHWMVKKHEWIFKELVKLKKYLNSINHRPFETDIEVNILFKNLFNIENYLYDDVSRFLKGEHNGT